VPLASVAWLFVEVGWLSCWVEVSSFWISVSPHVATEHYKVFDVPWLLADSADMMLEDVVVVM
jgi:hypothetical protein